MKISCKIIEDLLPLYIDEVCSEDSKKIIEEHLSQCSKCEENFKKMKMSYISEENIEINLKEAESIKNLSEKWNRKIFLAKLKGVVSTLVFVSLLLLFIHIFVGIKISWEEGFYEI